MFADSFLPNLIIFLVGQAVAWGYMRTGLVRRGIVLMVAIWVLADVALLARFAYREVGAWYTVPLMAMQGYAAIEALLFIWGQLRRRVSGTAKRRGELFKQAFAHYLRDELDEAETILRRLRRSDPWDLQAALELANVFARKGRSRRALGLYRLARSLDRRQEYRDLIGAQLRRFGGRRRAAAVAAEPAAPDAAATPESS